MGLSDVIQNINTIRSTRQTLYIAKFNLLNRLTMAQIDDIYSTYCCVANEGKREIPQEATMIDIYNAVTQPSSPHSRKQYIDKIMKEVSWDTLKHWAISKKVDIKDLMS